MSRVIVVIVVFPGHTHLLYFTSQDFNVNKAYVPSLISLHQLEEWSASCRRRIV